MGHSSDGTTTHFIDLDSVQKFDDNVRVWQKWLMKPGQSMLSSLLYLEIDCAQKRYRVLDGTAVAHDGEAIKIDLMSMGWFFPHQDSLHYRSIDTACTAAK